MTQLKYIGATLFAVLVVMGLAGLSQVPYTVADSDLSTVRLSWRVRSASREQCRTPSAEEQANVPVHMRQTEICETRPIPFTLRVLVDDRTVVEKSIVSAGARADRPIYVYEEMSVPAGSHTIDVHFFSNSESAESEDDPGQSAPANLRFSRRLQLGQSKVTLITYDESTDQLVLR